MVDFPVYQRLPIGWVVSIPFLWATQTLQDIANLSSRTLGGQRLNKCHPGTHHTTDELPLLYHEIKSICGIICIYTFSTKKKYIYTNLPDLMVNVGKHLYTWILRGCHFFFWHQISIESGYTKHERNTSRNHQINWSGDVGCQKVWKSSVFLATSLIIFT